MEETFDAKQEKLCHKNLAATGLNLMGKARGEWESTVGVEYITTFIFMIYDPSEFCEPQFPGQAHGVFATLATASSFFSHAISLSTSVFVSSSAEWNASIKWATLAAASRQTANQSQQQISPAQITLIVPNGKYPPYLHLSHSANYWPN